MVVADLLPTQTFIGVSLVIPQEGSFLFGIRPPKWIANQEILEITGIGGRLEKEDDSLTACAQREAYEEIAAPIRIIPAPRTLVVRGSHLIEEFTLQGPERPLALVFRGYRTPPHQPWHPQKLDSGCIVVFLAEVLDNPLPSEEIPYLAWLTARQIWQTARQDLSLRELIDDGARLLSNTANQPHRETTTRLTDSQEALALALGDQTIQFYQSLSIANGHSLK